MREITRQKGERQSSHSWESTKNSQRKRSILDWIITSSSRLLLTMERHAHLVLVGMMVLYALILFGGLTFKYVHWGQGYDQIDYQQSIWNTTQGRFLEISHYRHTDHLWGMDFIPAIVLLVPFYALFPSALTLNFFQAVFMALGAWPVYNIARDRFNNSRLAGIGWAAIYLLYPSLWFVTMSAPWQPRTLAIPALLGAFYMLQQRRWAWCMALLALALTTRTDASLVVCMFGILAGLWRMGWRWVLPPLLLGLTWFYVSTSVIVPAFYRDDYQPQAGAIGQSYDETWPGTSPQLAYYSHLGNSTGEIVRTIVTRPVNVAQLMLTPQKMTYLVLMLLPLAFLPLLAPDVALLASPIIAMNLLSTRVFQYTIREQYQALVIPGLVLAAIIGGARLWRWWGARRRGDAEARTSSPLHFRILLPAPCSLLLAGFVLYALMVNMLLKNPVVTTILYREEPARIALMEEMRAMVPPDASLATTSFLAPRMMPRRQIYYLPPGPMFPPLERAEYLFIDTRASALQGSDFVAQIRAAPEWEIIADADDLLLVRQTSYHDDQALAEQ